MGAPDHYQSTNFTKSYLVYLYNTVPRDHDLLTGTDNVVTVTYTIYTPDKNRKHMQNYESGAFSY